MKIAEVLVIAFYVSVAVFSVVFGYKAMTVENVQLPCGVAEISPDFSPEDRERCRLVRGTHTYEYRSK